MYTMHCTTFAPYTTSSPRTLNTQLYLPQPILPNLTQPNPTLLTVSYTTLNSLPGQGKYDLDHRGVRRTHRQR